MKRKQQISPWALIDQRLAERREWNRMARENPDLFDMALQDAGDPGAVDLKALMEAVEMREAGL